MTEDGQRRTEGGGLMTDDRGRMTEDGGRWTGPGRRKTEGRPAASLAAAPRACALRSAAGRDGT